MASNIVTGGLGSRLLLGGLSGNGLPTGSTTAVQNPGFEVPGATPGDASNWTTATHYTESEYATFSRPGLTVVANTIPAQQPTLGFSIVHNIDATITITQAANEGGAQEDFEEGWSNNQQFMLALQATLIASSTFENKLIETFEGGWANDPGLENDFDTIVSAISTFSFHLDAHSGVPTQNTFENFEGYWPSNATGQFVTAIPNVIFGIALPTTSTDLGSFEVVHRIIDSFNGVNQFADVLQMRVMTVPKTPFTISLTYLDKDELIQSATVTIPQDTKIGTILVAPSTVTTGIRYIESFTPDGVHGYPGISFEGDPGVAFIAGTTTELDSWVRAEFTGP